MESGFSIPGLDDLEQQLEAMIYKDLLQVLHKALITLGEWLLAQTQHITPIDTAALYNSFQRGHPENIWELNLEAGTLRLTLGTSNDHALPIEEGHWTNPEGVAVRWVPGYWVGDRFIYDPTSDTGMALKQQWVKGYHMFEIAFEQIERIAGDYLDRTIQEVFNRAAQRIRT